MNRLCGAAKNHRQPIFRGAQPVLESMGPEMQILCDRVLYERQNQEVGANK
jgi:hypothetical protein